MTKAALTAAAMQGYKDAANTIARLRSENAELRGRLYVAIEKERERCARMAETYELGAPAIRGIQAVTAMEIAAEIRALKDET